mmetsp:Transcript_60634/g.192464  ORF Transcript_60634/g.192464 Transcript_60634/m.192464 type:complete len:284 (+) Transcript_60634:1331-2182(+)
MHDVGLHVGGCILLIAAVLGNDAAAGDEPPVLEVLHHIEEVLRGDVVLLAEERLQGALPAGAADGRQYGVLDVAHGVEGVILLGDAKARLAECLDSHEHHLVILCRLEGLGARVAARHRVHAGCVAPPLLLRLFALGALALLLGGCLRKHAASRELHRRADLDHVPMGEDQAPEVLLCRPVQRGGAPASSSGEEGPEAPNGHPRGALQGDLGERGVQQVVHESCLRAKAKPYPFPSPRDLGGSGDLWVQPTRELVERSLHTFDRRRQTPTRARSRGTSQQPSS